MTVFTTKNLLFMTLIVFLMVEVIATQTPVGAVTKSHKEKDSEHAVPAIPPGASYLLFKINYVYRPGGKEEFDILRNDSILHSGDHYKIIFTPASDCYVYIFQVDSANKTYRLFPMESFGGVTVNNFNPIRAGKTYYIPAEGKSFILDEQQGTEKIYFLATRQRDVTLEEHYQELFEAQHSKGALKKQQSQPGTLFSDTIKSRKIVESISDPAETETTAWQEDGQTFSVLRQRLENMCNGCVYMLTFTHE